MGRGSVHKTMGWVLSQSAIFCAEQMFRSWSAPHEGGMGVAVGWTPVTQVSRGNAQLGPPFQDAVPYEGHRHR